MTELEEPSGPRVWWRYRVVDVGGSMIGRVSESDTIMDYSDGPPDGQDREWTVMNMDTGNVTGWIVGEPYGDEYTGPFRSDGRPGNNDDKAGA